MQKELSFEEGTEAVRLARKSIEYYSATGSRWREKAGNDKFLKERGVFVTIRVSRQGITGLHWLSLCFEAALGSHYRGFD